MIQKLIPTITAHLPLILSVLYAALSFLNGALKNPNAKTSVGYLLDLVAFLKRADAPGTLKMPFTQSSNSGLPLPPTTALLPFLLIQALLFSSCLSHEYCVANPNDNRCKIQAVASDCGEPTIIKEVAKVLPTVVIDLINQQFGNIPNDVLNVLKTDGLIDAGLVASCAVKSVDASLVAPKGAALSYETIMLKSYAQSCLANCAWMKK